MNIIMFRTSIFEVILARFVKNFCDAIVEILNFYYKN